VRRLAISLAAVMMAVAGGILASAPYVRAAATATSYCQRSHGFKSCLEHSGSTMSATGTAHGICALFPAREKLTSSGGIVRYSRKRSHWCGSPALVAKFSVAHPKGTWCAILQEGPNPQGHTITLAKMCHRY
jgi:hypothetical protein